MLQGSSVLSIYWSLKNMSPTTPNNEIPYGSTYSSVEPPWVISVYPLSLSLVAVNFPAKLVFFGDNFTPIPNLLPVAFNILWEIIFKRINIGIFKLRALHMCSKDSPMFGMYWSTSGQFLETKNIHQIFIYLVHSGCVITGGSEGKIIYTYVCPYGIIILVIQWCTPIIAS